MGRITIQILGESISFDKTIDAAEAKLGNLGKAAESANRVRVASDKKAADDQKAIHDEAFARIERGLQAREAAEKRSAKELERTTREVAKSRAAEEEKYQRQVEAATAQSRKRMEASFASTFASLTGHIRSYSQQLFNIATGGGLSALIRGTAEFDTQIRNVGSILSANDPTMAQFQERILEISKGSAKSATDLAGGLYQAISDGVPATLGAGGALDLLNVAQKAATAGLATTEEAVRAGTIVFNTFGASAGTTREVFDKLFTVVARGSITFPQLARSLGNVATTASSAGTSFNFVAAALELLSKAGLSSQRSATAVAAVISQIEAPAVKAEAAFKRLAIPFGRGAVEGNNLVTTLARINEVTKGDAALLKELIPQKNARLAIQKLEIESGALIPQKNARLAIQKLEIESGAQLLQSMEAQTKASGALERAAAAQSGGIQAQLQNMQNSFSALAIQVVDRLGPQLRDVFKGVSEAVNSINPDHVAKAIVSFGQQVAGALKFLYDFRDTIGAIVKGFLFFKAIDFVTGGISAIKGAFDGLSGGVAGLNVALMGTGPIGGLLTAINLIAKALAAAAVAGEWLGRVLANAFGDDSGAKAALRNVQSQQIDLKARDALKAATLKRLGGADKEDGGESMAQAMSVRQREIEDQIRLGDIRVKELEQERKFSEAIGVNAREQTEQVKLRLDLERKLQATRRMALEDVEGLANKLVREASDAAGAEFAGTQGTGGGGGGKPGDPKAAARDARERLSAREQELQKRYDLTLASYKKEDALKLDAYEKEAGREQELFDILDQLEAAEVARMTQGLHDKEAILAAQERAHVEAQKRIYEISTLYAERTERDAKSREKDAEEANRRKAAAADAFVSRYASAAGNAQESANYAAYKEAERRAGITTNVARYSAAFVQSGLSGIAGTFIDRHIVELGESGVGNLSRGISRLGDPNAAHGEWVYAAGEIFKGAAQLAGVRFANLAIGAGEALVDFLGSKFGEYLGLAGSSSPAEFASNLQGSFDESARFIDNLVENLPTLFAKLEPFIREIGPKLAQAVPVVVGAFVRGAPGVVKALLGELPAIGRAVIREIPAIMELVARQGAEVVSSLITFAAQNITPLVNAFVEGAGRAIGGVIRDAMSPGGLGTSLAKSQARLGLAGFTGGLSEFTGFSNIIGLREGGLVPHIQAFAEGGVVQNLRDFSRATLRAAQGDGILVRAHPDEGVVNARGMRHLGADGLAALNAGRSPAGRAPAIELHIHGENAPVLRKLIGKLSVGQARAEGSTARSMRELGDSGFVNLPGLSPLVET